MATKPVYSKLKKWLIVFLMLILVFVGYVEIVNLNSTDMTYRQKVLKAVYPVWMWFTRLTGKNNARIAGRELSPPVSFYTLKSTLNNGQLLDFNELKGKKILLVNTASDCGYTEQYADLQKLYEQYKDKLLVIGFPANDFKEQEKGTDEEIARFCQLNFGVNFPLMKKSVVVKNAAQHDVFRWLTDSSQNGWNNKAPSWNFSKYLVNEKGLLVNYFDPSVSPMGNDIREAIEK
jgi:glutathione peroxidase